MRGGLYTTSVYTPPPAGEQYSVNLYNGSTFIRTDTAYELFAYSPANPPFIAGKTFNAWYYDSALTNRYFATMLTTSTVLYAEYVNVSVNHSNSLRIYFSSTTSWWYNDNADIYVHYATSSSSFTIEKMRKENNTLHSAVIPNSSYTRLIFDRRNPADGKSWNATGIINVVHTNNNVIRFSGPTVSNWTGPLTITEYQELSPDIIALKQDVPLLTCDNYDKASVLLDTYNRLGDNEKSIVDALTFSSHDNVKLGYKSVVDYYVLYKAWVANNPSPSPLLNVVEMNRFDWQILLLAIGAFAVSSIGYLIIRKKRVA